MHPKKRDVDAGKALATRNCEEERELSIRVLEREPRNVLVTRHVWKGATVNSLLKYGPSGPW